jgi:hypothetical protein
MAHIGRILEDFVAFAQQQHEIFRESLKRFDNQGLPI